MPGGNTGRCTPFCPPLVTKERRSEKFAERFLVHGRLRADRQRRAHLRDDHANFARRNLHPRIHFNVVEQPRLPAAPRHQEIGLVARFAMKRDRVVVFQLSQTETLHDQPDFRRSHDANRHPQVKSDQQEARNDNGWSRIMSNMVVTPLGVGCDAATPRGLVKLSCSLLLVGMKFIRDWWHFSTEVAKS